MKSEVSIKTMYESRKKIRDALRNIDMRNGDITTKLLKLIAETEVYLLEDILEIKEDIIK